MKSRRTMHSFSLKKKKNLKVLKTSISSRMKDSSNSHNDSSNSDNGNNNNDKKSIKDKYRNESSSLSENEDGQSNIKYRNEDSEGNTNSELDFMIKRNKTKTKKLSLVKEKNTNKSITKSKSKNKSEVKEKENRNTNNIKRNKLIVDDEENDKNENESNESDPSSEDEISFLPCREEEQKKIYNYIKDGLQTTGAYSSLYIAGMPGTGKTASLLTVIKKLQYESTHSMLQAKKSSQTPNKQPTPIIPPFNYLYLNGMKIPNPASVFKLIHNHIFSEQHNQNINKFIQILDNFFRNREEFDYKTILKDIKNSHIILIVDEVDCLINQKQNLLYNIFNWTTYSKSKLIVISISNTLDLPNRLQQKIQSRMGTNKLMFLPYAKKELYTIISVKINDVDLFSEDALKYSCVKVAAINGDLRRILLIIKRAKELFFREKERNKSIKKIEKRHIIKACQELFDSKLIKVILSLQLLEKVIIATVLYIMKVDSETKIKVSDVYQKKNILLKDLRYELNWEEFTSIIFNLISLKIISFSEVFKENFVNNYVCIKFYTDEFMNAVEKDESFKEVLPILQSLLNN